MNEYSHLVTGGCRSGKSRFALKLAENAVRPCFIATAVAGDDPEMLERIARHQAERGDHWRLIEEPIRLGEAILRAESDGADAILVDCLTIWTANALFESRSTFETELEKLADALRKSIVQVVLVTNEVGAGIVPIDAVSRDFRDSAGIANQTIAALVPNVTMTICGIPTRVKQSSES